MLNLKLDHSDAKTTSHQDRLSAYSTHLHHVLRSADYDQPEASIKLPADDKLLAQVQAVAAEKVTPQLKYSLVVGIGGSNLGTKAVYDALLGYADILQPQRFPKMIFAETTDPDQLTRLTALLDTLTGPEEILVTVISKSGGTTETIANFEIIMKALRDKFGAAADRRVVAISDDGSGLMKAAEAHHIATLTIPATVGGRYSVLSAVGLLPLLSVGIDIQELRAGASELLDYCFDQDNLAAASATVLADQHGKGHHINDNFFFHPELESLGKWYRQLMGESIGKEKSKDGQTVHTGITPTVSVGSADLHSVLQLYLGGPRDKITTFVSAGQGGAIEVPSERLFADLVPMINGKSAAGIMSAILGGTKIAYQKAGLPYMEVLLPAIDERSIGSFLQFKMLEMMYLGELLNVNSFDQPNVEDYKLETKRLLQA